MSTPWTYSAGELGPDGNEEQVGNTILSFLLNQMHSTSIRLLTLGRLSAINEINTSVGSADRSAILFSAINGRFRRQQRMLFCVVHLGTLVLSTSHGMLTALPSY
jgi:uncharacterized protein YejL (UPF0352 family)